MHTLGVDIEGMFPRYYGYLGKIKRAHYIDVLIGAYGGICFFIETVVGHKYVLKFSRGNFKNYKEIEYVFRAVREVRKRGFTQIPDIILTDNKKAGVIEHSGRSFILYEFKEGKTMNQFDYLKLGMFLARFHNAVQYFKRKDPRMKHKKVLNIEKQIRLLNEALKNKNINSGDFNYIFKHIRHFRNNFLGQGYELNEGVIHGDFNSRNILQRRGQLTGLIDLDDLHADARILDFSKAILHGPVIEDLVKFVNEYQTCITEKLSKDEIFALPEIWRYRLIKMLIWAVRKMGGTKRKKLSRMVKKDYNLWLKILKKFNGLNWDYFYKKAMQQTKIIATIGRASDTKEEMIKMVLSGMDVARLNFSYDTHAKHQEVLNNLRRVEKKLDKQVFILQDLGGAKLRIGPLENDEVELISGQKLILTVHEIIGSAHKMSINYPALPKDVQSGDRMLLEGKEHLIELKVVSIASREIETEVVIGGRVRKRKGLHVPGVKLSIPLITEKDRKDLKFGIKNGVDYIALSFVQSAQVVSEFKKILKEAGAPQIKIIAKIENQTGINNIDEIIKVADMIMVARGDLRIEVPREKLPIFQEIIVNKCRKIGKPVIVATGFLESMIENKRPRKSEINDIKLAVRQGVDYLLLSPETAKGKYPAEAVATMRKIIYQTKEK